MPKKQEPIRLTYLDSRDPGIITMRLKPTWPGTDVMGGVSRRMTIHEAAELSQQLSDAVRASGYDMVARVRKGR